MIRRPPRSTQSRSSAASDVYKRQHQEMPKGGADGRLWGLQLWTNLPRSHKMMAPRYRGIKAEDIPEVILDSGAHVKVICGTVDGIRGPVQDIIAEPEYLDITVPLHSRFQHRVTDGHTALAYVCLLYTSDAADDLLCV